MTGRLNVGVWYIDASMVEILEEASIEQLRSVFVPALLGGVNEFETVDLAAVVATLPPTQAHPAAASSYDPSAVVLPPCLPLVYGSMFFAWPTVRTVQFFSDAEAWTARQEPFPQTCHGRVWGFVFDS